jgi:hypothetical protein
MTQKQIDSYIPRNKRPKRPRKSKKELDTWIIEDVNRGYKSIPNPEDDQEYPFVDEDCAEITLRKINSYDTIKKKDDIRMIKFWEARLGFTFKWKGGKRIKMKTLMKALGT